MLQVWFLGVPALSDLVATAVLLTTAMPEPVVGTDETVVEGTDETVVEGAVDQTTAESGGGVEDETSTEQGNQAGEGTHA